MPIHYPDDDERPTLEDWAAVVLLILCCALLALIC